MTDDFFTTTIIRKSFILLIFRIIVAELLLESIYVAWRIGIYMIPISPELQSTLNIWTTVLFVIITVIQLILLVVILLRWLNEYYELQRDEIIVWNGVLTRKGRSYPYTNIQSISVDQDILGRLFNYGTVMIYVPALGQELHFEEVPKPYEFIEIIKNNIPKAEGNNIIIRKN